MPILRTRFQKVKFTPDGQPFVICYRKKLMVSDFLKKEVEINGIKKVGNYAISNKIYHIKIAENQDAVKVTIAG